jgi:threonine dehydratase
VVSYQDIVLARARIKDAIYYSPCAHTVAFSKLTGLKIALKLENLQMTGSFKERGAMNRLALLSETERAAGVIAASAGNHAQGVAFHASRLGVRATIVMPETTPLVKVTATREFGATVILHGAGYDDAYEEARRRCASEGSTLIHAFDDEAIIAGQGTIGLELLEQQPDLDAVVVPVGGGGLISGIACAIKERKPSVRVVGVQTQRIPSAQAALRAGAPTTLPPAITLADGIAVRRTGEHTLPMIQRYVDEIVTVDEDEIANAILLLVEREKTVAEGAGACAVAAVINQRTGITLGKRTVLVIGGGNIDVNLLSRIIESGLAKDGRRLKLEVRLPDVPGALHGLIGIFARLRANVLEIEHLRAFGVDLGDTIVDVTIETRGLDHVTEIVAALRAGHYDHRRVLS